MKNFPDKIVQTILIYQKHDRNWADFFLIHIHFIGRYFSVTTIKKSGDENLTSSATELSDYEYSALRVFYLLYSTLIIFSCSI